MIFSAIDILFILILLLFAFIAAAKGLIAEFFGKAALFCGIGASAIFYRRLAPYIQKFINKITVSRIISFLVIFIVAYLCVKIVQSIIARLFSGEILGSLDHALGFLFGAAEGFIVITFIIILMLVQPWFRFDSVLSGSFFVSLLHSLTNAPADYVKGIVA
jgi:membrane protein required for colicin V production